MIVARSRGLDCGPMSGFNAAKVNKVFFTDSSYEANFLCNLGYCDGDSPYPRLARLDFAEVCKII
jgi:nitroreductase